MIMLRRPIDITQSRLSVRLKQIPPIMDSKLLLRGYLPQASAIVDANSNHCSPLEQLRQGHSIQSLLAYYPPAIVMESLEEIYEFERNTTFRDIYTQFLAYNSEMEEADGSDSEEENENIKEGENKRKSAEEILKFIEKNKGDPSYSINSANIHITELYDYCLNEDNYAYNPRIKKIFFEQMVLAHIFTLPLPSTQKSRTTPGTVDSKNIDDEIQAFNAQIFNAYMAPDRTKELKSRLISNIKKLLQKGVNAEKITATFVDTWLYHAANNLAAELNEKLVALDEMESNADRDQIIVRDNLISKSLKSKEEAEQERLAAKIERRELYLENRDGLLQKFEDSKNHAKTTAIKKISELLTQTLTELKKEAEEKFLGYQIKLDPEPEVESNETKDAPEHMAEVIFAENQKQSQQQNVKQDENTKTQADLQQSPQTSSTPLYERLLIEGAEPGNEALHNALYQWALDALRAKHYTQVMHYCQQEDLGPMRFKKHLFEVIENIIFNKFSLAENYQGSPEDFKEVLYQLELYTAADIDNVIQLKRAANIAKKCQDQSIPLSSIDIFDIQQQCPDETSIVKFLAEKTNCSDDQIQEVLTIISDHNLKEDDTNIYELQQLLLQNQCATFLPAEALKRCITPFRLIRDEVRNDSYHEALSGLKYIDYTTRCNDAETNKIKFAHFKYQSPTQWLYHHPELTEEQISQLFLLLKLDHFISQHQTDLNLQAHNDGARLKTAVDAARKLMLNTSGINESNISIACTELSKWLNSSNLRESILTDLLEDIRIFPEVTENLLKQAGKAAAQTTARVLDNTANSLSAMLGLKAKKTEEQKQEEKASAQIAKEERATKFIPIVIVTSNAANNAITNAMEKLETTQGEVNAIEFASEEIIQTVLPLLQQTTAAINDRLLLHSKTQGVLQEQNLMYLSEKMHARLDIEAVAKQIKQRIALELQRKKNNLNQIKFLKALELFVNAMLAPYIEKLTGLLIKSSSQGLSELFNEGISLENFSQILEYLASKDDFNHLKEDKFETLVNYILDLINNNQARSSNATLQKLETNIAISLVTHFVALVSSQRQQREKLKLFYANEDLLVFMANNLVKQLGKNKAVTAELIEKFVQPMPGDKLKIFKEILSVNQVVYTTVLSGLPGFSFMKQLLIAEAVQLLLSQSHRSCAEALDHFQSSYFYQLLNHAEHGFTDIEIIKILNGFTELKLKSEASKEDELEFVFKKLETTGFTSLEGESVSVEFNEALTGKELLTSLCQRSIEFDKAVKAHTKLKNLPAYSAENDEDGQKYKAYTEQRFQLISVKYTGSAENQFYHILARTNDAIRNNTNPNHPAIGQWDKLLNELSQAQPDTTRFTDSKRALKNFLVHLANVVTESDVIDDSKLLDLAEKMSKAIMYNEEPSTLLAGLFGRRSSDGGNPEPQESHSQDIKTFFSMMGGSSS